MTRNDSRCVVLVALSVLFSTAYPTQSIPRTTRTKRHGKWQNFAGDASHIASENINGSTLQMHHQDPEIVVMPLPTPSPTFNSSSLSLDIATNVNKETGLEIIFIVSFVLIWCCLATMIGVGIFTVASSICNSSESCWIFRWCQKQNHEHGIPAGSITAVPYERTDYFTKHGSEEPCSICLELLAPSQEAKELLCDHCFHAECLDAWLLYSAICPVSTRIFCLAFNP